MKNNQRFRVWLKNGDKLDFDATGTNEMVDAYLKDGALVVSFKQEFGDHRLLRILAAGEWTNAEWDPVRW